MVKQRVNPALCVQSARGARFNNALFRCFCCLQAPSDGDRPIVVEPSVLHKGVRTFDVLGAFHQGPSAPHQHRGAFY